MARKKKVGILDLNKAITEVLTQYGDDVYEVLGEAIDEVTDEGVKKLKSVDHFAQGRRPSGDYSKDWTSVKEPVGRLKKKTVIYNEEHYRLAHLLEYGHVTRNGTGRVFRRTPAYPHIKPVETWINSELPKKVEELMQRK